MTTLDIIIFIVTCIFSYFLGGISIARFITGGEKKENITKQGSGNPGTMNMLRTHGVGMGLFTLLCDALKGVIPALFGLLYFGDAVSFEMGYISLYTFDDEIPVYIFENECLIDFKDIKEYMLAFGLTPITC